jgi:hypothetical protein
MDAKKFLKAIALTIGVSGLVACGGGGGDDVAGIGGTGITASGSITGFGSIYVNGIRFDVDSADITVDGDDTVDDTALKLGMVVKVQGVVDDTGLAGIAATVEFDEVLQGPVNSVIGTGNARTLSILGVQVFVSEGATVFEGVAFSNLDNLGATHDVVEISGYLDENNNILATRLEYVEAFSTSAEVEARGFVVEEPDVNIFGLDINGDGVSDRLVDTTPSTGLLASDLSAGQLVEIAGYLAVAHADNTVFATDVEYEDTVLGDANGEASLEGIVTNLNAPLRTFTLNGVSVDYTNATFEPLTLADSLANGLQVEVEGQVINGSILIADEIEAEDEVELSAIVSSKSAPNITLSFNSGTVDVVTDGNTDYEDDVVGSGYDFSAVDLGHFVKVEGHLDADGNVLAAQVKRVDPSDDIVQGPVSDCTSGAPGSITLMGVTFSLLNGTTSYADQNENSVSDNTAFCNLVNAGTYFVKVQDDATANGVADEAELED